MLPQEALVACWKGRIVRKTPSTKHAQTDADCQVYKRGTRAHTLQRVGLLQPSAHVPPSGPVGPHEKETMTEKTLRGIRNQRLMEVAAKRYRCMSARIPARKRAESHRRHCSMSNRVQCSLSCQDLAKLQRDEEIAVYPARSDVPVLTALQFNNVV